MAFTINTNIVSLTIQKDLTQTSNALNQTNKSLASGKRLTSASIDPAALQMAAQMLSEEAGLGVSIANVNDGVSKLSIADAALSSASDIAGRMAELATQAASDTVSQADRDSLNQEFQQLKSELDRISSVAKFNDQSVFGQTVLQTGTDGSASSQTTINVTAVSSSTLQLANADISSAANARSALDLSQSAVDTIASNRAEIGAAESRLSTIISNNRSMQIETASARSTIEDADMAKVTADATAQNIRLQISTALLAQANSTEPANVLKLLQA